MNELQQIRQDVTRILTALCGDDISDDGGLVQRVTDTETGLKDIRTQLNEIKQSNANLSTHVKILWVSAGAILMAIFSLIIKS